MAKRGVCRQVKGWDTATQTCKTPAARTHTAAALQPRYAVVEKGVHIFEPRNVRAAMMVSSLEGHMPHPAADSDRIADVSASACLAESFSPRGGTAAVKHAHCLCCGSRSRSSTFPGRRLLQCWGRAACCSSCPIRTRQARSTAPPKITTVIIMRMGAREPPQRA